MFGIIVLQGMAGSEAKLRLQLQHSEKDAEKRVQAVQNDLFELVTARDQEKTAAEQRAMAYHRGYEREQQELPVPVGGA